MVTSRGGAEARRFMAQLPGQIETKLLRGAGRAAAKVVAEEAKARSISHEVSDAITTRVTSKGGTIIAKVQVKGKGAYLAPWLEYGTAPHFISVDENQRGGRSIGRINKLVREGSLVIGGKFVGATVHHPGAKPHPFLRPALDNKESEAIAAAQGFINAHVTPAGITAGTQPEGDE